MELIEDLGTRQDKNGHWRRWGKFKCPHCLQEVERLLRNGKTYQSCGCIKNKIVSEKNTKHNESKTRLYRIWNGIKNRCLNPNIYEYKDYGGRNITICDEWKNNYTVFRDWSLSNGYRDDLTIDRRENDGNYEPSNCRWTTVKENSRYTRRTKIKGMGMANEIRYLYSIGNYTGRKLSEKYRMSLTAIYDIINNKTWKL